MKKLGLRAVAGGLALLLTASAFAPATTANAADVLITAKAPKTLVITAEMVDDDGEVIISGEKWDRIIVGKEVEAKDIYFDGVDVGELVVESGSKSNVQLWDVAAEALTVKEPELVELDMAEIRALLVSAETRDKAMELYRKVQEDNKKALKQAPSIVTMAKAVVGTVTASGSVNLDFKQGDIKAFNLEAGSKVSQMDVTLEGYNGEVTYKGSEKFNIVNFKTVGCKLEKLTVDSAASNNFFNVKSKDSSVASVEVAGNAAVSLNIPTAKLEIAESASGAQIGILSEVGEMNVAADNAVVNVGAVANIVSANISGDKVNIGGQGKLENVEITGTGAYVSTNGSNVKGENTYQPPVYVAPDNSDKAVDLEYEFKNLTESGWNKTALESDDDGLRYQLAEAYGGEVFYVLPEMVDAAAYEKVIIKVKVGSDSPDALRVKLTHEGADKDDWGNPVAFFSKEVASGSGMVEIEVPLDIHAGKMIDQVRFQSTANGTIATVYSVTFIARPDGPIDPIVLPTEGTQCTPNAWEVVVYNTVDFRRYAGTTVKITAEALRCGGKVGPKAQRQFNDSNWTEVEKNSYIEIGTDWTDFGVESFVVPAEWADAENPIYYGIRTVSGEDYSGCLIFQKGFSVKVTDGEEPAPEPEPEIPADSTECVPNKWEVKLFNDVDLRDYAGKEVTFSFDMIKTGTKGEVLVHVQLNNANYKTDDKGNLTGGYEVVKWQDYITDEWKSYSYTYKVPAEFADKEVQTNPIYFGLRTDDKVDYSPYKFYIKNYKFVGTSDDPTPDNPTPDDPTPDNPTPDNPTPDNPTLDDPTPDTPEVTFEITANKTILTVGEKLYLTAGTVTTSAVSWSTSDASIATVNDYGVVTAVSAGAVTITGTHKELKVSDTVELKVNAPEAKFVEIAANNANLYVGDTTQLSATTNDGKGTITWKSLDEAVATVDANGQVFTNKAGTVVITASCNGYDSDAVTLTVNANYVVVKTEAITLTVEDTLKLADLVEKASKTVKWSIKGDAAKIENGSVIAVAAGTATLTATCEEVSVNVEVTVEAPEIPKFVTTKDSVKATTNEDDSITVVATENQSGIRFSIPSTVDVAKVGKVILNVTADAQIGLQVYGQNGTMLAGEYPGYDYTETVTKDYVLYLDPSVDVPSSIQIQSNGGENQTFTVNSVKVVTEDLEKCTNLIFYPGKNEDGTDQVTVTSNEDGSATITSVADWTTAFYQFGANNVTLDGRTTVKVEVETAKAIQVLLINDDWSENVSVQAGWGLSSATTLMLGIEIPEDKAFTQICCQPAQTDATFTIKSITFSTVLEEIKLN